MWWKRRRFVRGDWGAIITELMGAQVPKGLLGIDTNMANVIPADIDEAAFSGAPAPGGLSADEKLAYERLSFVYAKHRPRLPDGAATADPVRNRGFARRPGGVFP